jgi:phosphate transport system substrate-binding protein
MMRAIQWCAAVSLATLLALVAGCNKPEQGAATGHAGGTPSGSSLTIKGSDTMVQLAQVWAQEFMKKHPDVKVSVTGGGSGTGIAALINKSTDIADSSRSIKDEEKQQITAKGGTLKEYAVAQDALSVIVNPANPVGELTLEQLKGIYTGRIANWKQVGGADQRIVLNSRETSSGSYAFFQEHVLGKGVPFAGTAMLQPSTSQIVNTVAQDKGGIGYVGLGYVNATVKTVKLKKNAAAPAVAPNVGDVLNGTYPLARPLFNYMVGEPTGPSKLWIDWVQGPEGQAVVAKLDFVPIKGSEAAGAKP